jgi:hypothetical protein
MRRRSLTLAIAVAAMTCGGILATRAEDWKATGEYVWHVVGGKGYEMEKDHTYGIGEFAGKFFNNKGQANLFDQAEVRCFGFNDVDAKRIKQGGYCVVADTDGDHAYLKYEANGNNTPGFETNGTFDYTSGTGKYKGITGKNTYHVVGGDLRPRDLERRPAAEGAGARGPGR